MLVRVNPENTADRIPRCAHSVVNLGSDTCIVYGGFGGTSWRTDGWGIARRIFGWAKVFAFAVPTTLLCAHSSRIFGSFPPKQGQFVSNWILKLKCLSKRVILPLPRYGHTMVNLGENRWGSRRSCLEDFGKLISIHHLEMYTQ